MNSHNKTDSVDFGGFQKSGIIGFEDQDIISQYTRAEAIADGVLIDLTKDFPIVKRVYKFPVAVTAAVWQILNSTPSEWIVGEVIALIIASQNNNTRMLDEGSHLFDVTIENAAPSDRHTFKIVCHPGDDMEPVLTISLPDED